MTFLFILTFLVSYILIIANCAEEYVPVVIWASQRFEKRPHLQLNKINSNSFESYLTEVLENKNPLIVLFLEQDLSPSDFDWRDEFGYNSFPFLNNLSMNSRVDYFKQVESPYQALTQLSEKGYNWDPYTPETNFDIIKTVVLLVEFSKIINQRPDTLRKHDETISVIHNRLESSGKDWICIYAARHPNKKELLSILKPSSWHVDQQFPQKPTKALSLFQDYYTGFALFTRGPVQLYLPSPREFALKNLESCLGASAKRTKDKINFIMRFHNYTINFNLNKTNGLWLIENIKILNDNGDELKLIHRSGAVVTKHKCPARTPEFQSQGKPIVKVKLSKFKFLRLQLNEDQCETPYSLTLISSFILGSILSAIICWSAVLETFSFSKKSKVVTLSPKAILSRSKY